MKTKKTRKKIQPKYRSKAEAKFAEYLEETNIKFIYEAAPIEYDVIETRKYWPDFLCGKIFIEFKGKFDAQARKKMRLVKEQHPDLDVRLVFMQDNRLSKKSNTRYSDWARKYGFKFHVGVNLPQAWLLELR